MKFIMQSLITIFLSLITFTVFASSTVTLSGNGPIAPGGEVKVSLSSLKPGMQYSIQCDVKNGNKENVIIGINAYQGPGGAMQSTIRIPGANWQLGNAQGEIKPGIANILICPSSWAPESFPIVFLNLDNELSVELISCIAKPLLGSC